MRIIGLFIIAVLLPVTAYAALVNINTADAALLDTLPGIGPSKAAAIIDYRTKNGPFAAIEDIQKVSGIGPATFANMKELITVSQPSSNTTSYEKVQAVTPASPIINQKTNIQQNEEAVIAPSPVLVSRTGEGAAMPATTKKSTGLFHSPWTLGLLGVIILSVVAFVFI